MLEVTTVGLGLKEVLIPADMWTVDGEHLKNCSIVHLNGKDLP